MADFTKGGIMFRTLTDEECGAAGHQQHGVKFADDRLFGTSCECGERWTSEYVQPSREARRGVLMPEPPCDYIVDRAVHKIVTKTQPDGSWSGHCECGCGASAGGGGAGGFSYPASESYATPGYSPTKACADWILDGQRYREIRREGNTITLERAEES